MYVCTVRVRGITLNNTVQYRISVTNINDGMYYSNQIRLQLTLTCISIYVRK